MNGEKEGKEERVFSLKSELRPSHSVTPPRESGDENSLALKHTQLFREAADDYSMMGDMEIAPYCVKLHVMELIELSFRKGDCRNKVSGEVKLKCRLNSLKSCTGIRETEALQFGNVMRLYNDTEGHSSLPFSINYPISFLAH